MQNGHGTGAEKETNPSITGKRQCLLKKQPESILVGQKLPRGGMTFTEYQATRAVFLQACAENASVPAHGIGNRCTI